MTPYERLMAEQIPVRPTPANPRPRPTEPASHWTPEEQAEHRRILLEALDGWHWDEDPRHLRLIHDAGTNAA